MMAISGSLLTKSERALPGYIPPHKRDKRRADSYLKTLENRRKEKAALEGQLEANRLKRREFWTKNGYGWMLRIDRPAAWKERYGTIAALNRERTDLTEKLRQKALDLYRSPDDKDGDGLVDTDQYPDKIGQKKAKLGWIALVDEANCSGCSGHDVRHGEWVTPCQSVCPVDCISHLTPEQVAARGYDRTVHDYVPPVQIRFDECISCDKCAQACARDAWNAITMVKTDKLEQFFGVTITNKYPGRASNNIDLTKLNQLTDEQFLSLYTEV
jgi:ferredoxin